MKSNQADLHTELLKLQALAFFPDSIGNYQALAAGRKLAELCLLFGDFVAPCSTDGIELRFACGGVSVVPCERISMLWMIVAALAVSLRAKPVLYSVRG